MPLHDWTRVDAGIFHDFHLAWIAELRRSLNGGLLPSEYYALAEQDAGDGNPDVLTLRGPQPAAEPVGAGTALLTAPREARVMARAEREAYSSRQRRLAIRHTSGHRVIALIELVSAGNKSGVYPWQTLLDKLLGALRRGVHLLVLDAHPPTRRDPAGVHGALWVRLTGEEYEAPAGADRTLAAYSAGLVKTAYVEPISVGQLLPDMPLFLTPDGDGCVEVPLEQTYMAAYGPLPKFYRDILEAPG